MSIQSIRLLVCQELDAVNALMLKITKADINIIDDLATHIMQSGGKRLRPILVLLASKLCSYSGEEHIKLAAMVEIFHTATLLHDDVVDDSSLRRGKKTAHEIWGSKASILVGDYLLTLYMQLMIDLYNKDIMQICTDLSYEVTCGELRQIEKQNTNFLAEEHYFRIIRSKTSLLFAAACRMGAVISNHNLESQMALYNYGLHFGNAFQIIDDALDYAGNSNVLGKNIGDDLANGKYTLPLIYAHKYANKRAKKINRVANAR